jgi:hypothetical protein
MVQISLENMDVRTGQTLIHAPGRCLLTLTALDPPYIYMYYRVYHRQHVARIVRMLTHA